MGSFNINPVYWPGEKYNTVLYRTSDKSVKPNQQDQQNSVSDPQ